MSPDVTLQIVRKLFWNQAARTASVVAMYGHSNRGVPAVSMEAGRLYGLWEALACLDAEALDITFGTILTPQLGGTP